MTGSTWPWLTVMPFSSRGQVDEGGVDQELDLPRSSSSVDGTWAPVFDSASTTSCASWFTTLSLIRVLPTTAAAPASSGLHPDRRSAPTASQRDQAMARRATCLTSGVLPAGSRPRPRGTSRAARCRAAAGRRPGRSSGAARGRYGRGLTSDPRVEPLQPQLLRLGQLQRREPDCLPCSVTSVSPARRARTRNAGHREQVLHRPGGGAVPVAQLARGPPRTAASSVPPRRCLRYASSRSRSPAT